MGVTHELLDLAGGGELVDGAQRALERGLGVDGVQVQQLDALDPKLRQRGGHLLVHALVAQRPLGVGLRRHRELRGAAGERRAQRALGFTIPVYARRIQLHAAPLRQRRQRGVAVGGVEPLAEAGPEGLAAPHQAHAVEGAGGAGHLP